MTYFQKPNLPSILTGSGFIISFFTESIFLYLSLGLFTIAGVYWSYLEITSGINSFRKSLGWFGLFFIAMYLLYVFLMR